MTPPLTDSEINRAVAERLGYRIARTFVQGGYQVVGNDGNALFSFWWSWDGDPSLDDVAHRLPDYCNSLDAMHKALRSLPEELVDDIALSLRNPGPGRIRSNRGMLMLESRDIALAFLATSTERGGV